MKNKSNKGSKKKHQNTRKSNVNFQHKDRLFRFLFRDRKHLLQLYNALNGTDYQEEEDLTITTLEGAIYMGMKNDLSFIVDSVMNLYEHQSTWNPNMPLRGLLYFAKLYQVYVKKQGYDITGSRRIPLPLPQYIVFYNGSKEQPDHSELMFSDAFEGGKEEQITFPCLECRARMLNINRGHNQELLEKCRRLWEYAELIGRIRSNRESGMDIQQAVDHAVDSCIQEGILSDLLIHSKVEVVDMLLEEYNEKETREYLRREAWEEGHEAGKEEGLLEGQRVGRLEGQREGRLEGQRVGRLEGQREGQKLGELLAHMSLIRQKMKKGQTMEEIAEALEKPELYICAIQKWLEKYPGENEAVEHWKELQEVLKGLFAD